MEIKFRGKGSCDGAWVYGGLIQYKSGECAIISEKLSAYGHEATEIYRRDKVIPETVGQFIRLKDRINKEIFEGDIVKNLTEDIVQEIQYDIETARFVITGEGLLFDFDNTYSTELEIIGNRWENPGLMEGI